MRQAALALLAQQFRELPVLPPPPPWRQVRSIEIEGLMSVGYAPDSDRLLVVAADGRSVFDCRSGECLARDDDETLDWYNQITLTALGIGPLAGQRIRMAGLDGGGLPLRTNNGWSLWVETLDWPVRCVLLERPWPAALEGGQQRFKVATDRACALRACGFAETGRSFVVATNCDLTIWAC